MLGKFKHIHFVGIGGIGMSGIAQVLKNLGYHVSGSDINTSAVTKRLKRRGIKVYKGHKGEHVTGADAIVISSAVKAENPEVKEAAKIGIQIITRGEMLAELMRLKQGVAISGTHGKTTTTSLIGAVLNEGGLDPTLVIGGRVNSLRSNARMGNGKFLVAEADESDGSFLKLTPAIAVITNIDREHMDHYKDMDEVTKAYRDFAEKIPFDGFAVFGIDHPVVKSIARTFTKRSVTYGITSKADCVARKIRFNEGLTSFNVTYKRKRMGEIILPMLGMHNVQNALAAIAVGCELGISFKKVRKALRKFKGVGRRMERLYDGKVKVVDDYGHHPAEIAATLEGIKEAWPGRRRLVIFQPHRYTRTKDLFAQFPKALRLASHLWITNIYPAGEDPIRGITSRRLASKISKKGTSVTFMNKKEKIPENVYDNAQINDIIITLGAGDIWKVGKKLAQMFRARRSVGK